MASSRTERRHRRLGPMDGTAHPVPGPPPALRSVVEDRPTSSPMLVVGWVLLIAGIVGVAVGLVTGQIAIMAMSIGMIAAAGAVATVDLSDRTVAARRSLSALLLSGLTRRGPL